MAKAKRSRQQPRHKGRVRVLLLETQLPARLASSSRRQIPFMEELLRPFTNVELVPERVHSRSDLKKFLDLARRDSRIRVVHIVSHGEYSPKRPVIILTGDEKINSGGALRLDYGRYSEQVYAEGQNDREPDPPHGNLLLDCWRESSRRRRRAPASLETFPDLLDEVRPDLGWHGIGTVASPR